MGAARRRRRRWAPRPSGLMSLEAAHARVVAGEADGVGLYLGDDERGDRARLAATMSGLDVEGDIAYFETVDDFRRFGDACRHLGHHE